MKNIIILLALVMTITTITGCDGGRYEGLKLWEPGSPDHEAICGLKDWKTDEVIPVEAVPDTAWDHADWSWVPREGCPQ